MSDELHAIHSRLGRMEGLLEGTLSRLESETKTNTQGINEIKETISGARGWIFGVSAVCSLIGSGIIKFLTSFF